MASHIERRKFLATLLGGAAAAWPLAARAQQSAMPVIGFLSGRSPGESESVEAAFRQGLKESGYAEGQNVHIAFRWAEGRYDRLPVLVASLVDIRVAVIAAAGGQAVPLAAKAATSTIPIVFVSGEDPVKHGLVASLNRPGGSATGVSMFLSEMEAKRLALLHELVPTATMIGVIVNPSSPSIDTQLREINSAARALGRQIQIVNATNERELDAAFASLAQSKAGALLIASNAYFTSRRDQIVALAAQRAIPAIYDQREFPMAGGLVSYGTNLSDSYRLMGVYTGKILKGEKPTDLPVQQSTKFELVINLKTAKALGLDVPPALSARADEVIE
jgi:putative tryptophan/tyrosine transport system substrate-binding protein